MKSLVIKIYKKYRENQQRRLCVAGESLNMRLLSLQELTKEECADIKRLWEPVSDKDFTIYHRMFKTLSHFDARFVSDEYYYPIILRTLNPIFYARPFEHKGFYPLYYKEIPQPDYYVNKINGLYYDSSSNVISEEKAVELLKKVDSFIIKPTRDSLQGKNIRKINSKENDVLDVVRGYGDNFIAQEVLKQSSITSKFNNCSLNTFRITTLDINGETSLCNILFRCGQGDTPVDNGAQGGLMCGVTENGDFMEYAFDKRYQRFTTTKEGVAFAGTRIPNMKDIVNQVKQWHEKLIMHCGVVGWDIALNEHDAPVMIEMNLMWPGIQFEQLCSGQPLFGDRTEEVIEFVMTHRY